MALLEVFCNAFATFLNHAEEINLWPAVAKLSALHSCEDGTISVSKLPMDLNDGISREFMEIKTYGMHVRQEFSQSVGQRPENRDKNRYRDIVPFDKSRVVLDATDSSYVNASIIEGLMSCCTYIAAQGPLPGQICDFWRMIIRYRCPAIIMLCDLIEAGRSKCTKYWPEEMGKAQAYGSIMVTMVAEERLPVSSSSRPLIYTPISRTFEICSIGSDGRPVVTRCRQYQLNGWPDHGVPPVSAITSLIDLAALLIHTYPLSHDLDRGESAQNPLLIHCSAGCGRTGVFIGLHQICALLKLRQLDANTVSTGLLELVKSLRYQRPSMVQTFEQYVFLYQLVGTFLRRVSRSCLRRLAKMGVSVVGGSDCDPLSSSVMSQDNFTSNSPSPPPPKPPDPFGGSTNSLTRNPQQKLIMTQSPQSQVVIASGRLLATEIASEIVVAHRNSDWALLRRVSRVLAECIPRSVNHLQLTTSSPKAPPKQSPNTRPILLHRRASTAETPSSTRRSMVPQHTTAAIFNSKNNSPQAAPRFPVEKQPQKPALIGYEFVAGNPVLPGPPAQLHLIQSPDLDRLDGVEQQLAQLVSSVEKLSSSPMSPVSTSSRGGRHRFMHRRQLSGSYDNVNEVPSESAINMNGDFMSTSLSVETNGHDQTVAPFPVNNLQQDRIVIDLSNISPPYQNLMSSKQEERETPQKEQQNPLLSSQSLLARETSPPPPLPPPRRRKKEPPQEHHLSVAHLVLNQQPNETPQNSNNNNNNNIPQNIVNGGESATLGRVLRSTLPLGCFANGDGRQFGRGGGGNTGGLSGYSRPLQRQGSLILPASPHLGNHLPNIHFNSHFNGQPQRQNFQHHVPHQALKQAQSLMPPPPPPVFDANGDNNPYASLGRFRSVAQLGRVATPVAAQLSHPRSSLDGYPVSLPTTPSDTVKPPGPRKLNSDEIRRS